MRPTHWQYQCMAAASVWTDAALRDLLLRNRHPYGQFLEDWHSGTFGHGGQHPDQARSDLGALLTVLAGQAGAGLLLDVGTDPGFSTTCMARGLTSRGLVVSISPAGGRHRAAARLWSHLGLADRIDDHDGDPLELLHELPRNRSFDLAYVHTPASEITAAWDEALPRLRANGLGLVQPATGDDDFGDNQDSGDALAYVARHVATQSDASMVMVLDDPGLIVARPRGDASQPISSAELTCRVRPAISEEQIVDVTGTAFDRLDVYADDRPRGSIDVKDPRSTTQVRVPYGSRLLRLEAWLGGTRSLVKEVPLIPAKKVVVGSKQQDRPTRPEFGVGPTMPKPEEAPPTIVSTGFSDLAEPDVAHDRDAPLRPGKDYVFWLQIGERQAAAIDDEPTSLPKEIAADADLQVVLFALDDGLSLKSGQSVGLIRVFGDRPAETVAQPTSECVTGESGRLLFPLRTSSHPGVYRLRCNVYCRQMLVQSRIVTATVSQDAAVPRALTTTVDFTLSASLNPTLLSGRAEHQLSLMVNDDGAGTHTFMYAGKSGSKPLHVTQATFREGEIEDHVSHARGALRLATFGHEEPFRPEWEGDFKYRNRSASGSLSDDLIRMAVRGYRIYRSMTSRLAPASDQLDARQSRKALQEMMRTPGHVQVVTKRSPSLYLPAAVIYDHPLDDAVQPRLCSAFEDSLAARTHLADTDCFSGRCPNYGSDAIVCPSGFWGYRHAIGMPVSLTPLDDLADSPAILSYTGKPLAAVAVSTDLLQADAHTAELESRPGLLVTEVDESSKNQFFDQLNRLNPQIVYFYCHGGVHGTTPYLRIGHPNGGHVITSANIEDKCYWPQSRPLVILNGCHTTGLGPEQANELVSAFTNEPRASGVIGTETTIVEELATEFASHLLDAFLSADADQRGTSIGEAVRQARLALLQRRNPLGLLYVPFVPSDLTIQALPGQ